jgi:hypothetical protein
MESYQVLSADPLDVNIPDLIAAPAPLFIHFWFLLEGSLSSLQSVFSGRPYLP